MLAPAKNSPDNDIVQKIKKVLATLFINGLTICMRVLGYY
jgi:hypothetical protein